MAKEFQLTPQRRRILEVLRDHGEIRDKPGLAVNQLMGHTGHRTTNALSGVLQALEQAGLIAREVGGRRTYSIALTAKGKVEAERLAAGLPATIDEPPLVADAFWRVVELELRAVEQAFAALRELLVQVLKHGGGAR